jgi:hypothetical protein
MCLDMEFSKITMDTYANPKPIDPQAHHAASGNKCPGKRKELPESFAYQAGISCLAMSKLCLGQ